MTSRGGPRPDHPVAIPHGPAEELLGLSALEVSGDGALGSMALGPWQRDEGGTFAAGMLGVLGDNVVAQAVLAERPVDRWAVTTELAFDFFAEPPAEGRVTATGRLLSLDDGGGGATGTIVDDRGAVAATVTFWGRFIDGVPEAVTEARRAPAVARRPESVDALLGLTEVDGVPALFERPDFVNPLGMVHGGVLTAAVERAPVLAGFRPEGMATASLRMNFLRPASGTTSFAIRQVQRGRTFASAEVQALRPDGKAAAWALITYRSTER